MEFDAKLTNCLTSPEAIVDGLKKHPDVVKFYVSTTDAGGEIRVLCASSAWKLTVPYAKSSKTRRDHAILFKSALGLEFSSSAANYNYSFSALAETMEAMARKRLYDPDFKFVGQSGVLPDEEIAKHHAAVQAKQDSERAERPEWARSFSDETWELIRFKPYLDSMGPLHHAKFDMHEYCSASTEQQRLMIRNRRYGGRFSNQIAPDWLVPVHQPVEKQEPVKKPEELTAEKNKRLLAEMRALLDCADTPKHERDHAQRGVNLLNHYFKELEAAKPAPRRHIPFMRPVDPTKKPTEPVAVVRREPTEDEWREMHNKLVRYHVGEVRRVHYNTMADIEKQREANIARKIARFN